MWVLGSWYLRPHRQFDLSMFAMILAERHGSSSSEPMIMMGFPARDFRFVGRCWASS